MAVSWFRIGKPKSGTGFVIDAMDGGDVAHRLYDVKASALCEFLVKYPEARTVQVFGDDVPPDFDPDESKTTRRHAKPNVITRYQSPKYSSRNGTKIDMIVMHYTVSKTAQSAIDTLTFGARQASAHYVIDRDGTIYQLVSDDKKAWHAGRVNSRSIGIEHVAMPGERMAPEQTRSSVALCKYLLEEYHLEPSAITGHKFTGTATSCPGNLFGPKSTKDELDSWVAKHFS